MLAPGASLGTGGRISPGPQAAFVAALIYLFFVDRLDPLARWYGEAISWWWRSLF